MIELIEIKWFLLLRLFDNFFFKDTQSIRLFHDKKRYVRTILENPRNLFRNI